MTSIRENTQKHKTTLVLGGTGKTGRRVVQRLKARGLPVRVGSRSGEPPFDSDGVQRALGSEPRDFADFARAAATTGVWGGGRHV